MQDKKRKMKLYYVANFRMPTERAHGIQVAKMCEAFAEAGADVTLVVPRRKTDYRSIREFYNLRVDVPKVELFAFDWYARGRILYRVSSFSFMVSSFLYLWFRRRERNTVVYTIDADDWSYAQLPLLRIPYFSEMHSNKPKTFLNRLFFRYISGVITINRLIKTSLHDIFSYPNESIIVEHDAVDEKHFIPMSRSDARKKLQLSQDIKLILYIGRILAWKGLEILPEAAQLTGSEVTFGIVGGTKEQFVHNIKITDTPENLVFYGGKDFGDMPLWIAAADAVLLTSTALNELSYRWTSPMKAFEYMACGATIIAADTPALREIVSTSNAFLYHPDDAESLAHETMSALMNPEDALHRGKVAHEASLAYSWRGRAERILGFIASKSEIRREDYQIQTHSWK